MIKVYTSSDWALVQTMKTVLESYGIACKVLGEFRTSAAGELPPAECWPELWVLDDKRADEALKILAQSEQAGQQDRGSWTCGKCGELIEGQFDQCWQCGSSRR